MAHFAVAQASRPPCEPQAFAAEPTGLQATLMYAEPFAWPAAFAIVGVALIVAVSRRATISNHARAPDRM